MGSSSRGPGPATDASAFLSHSSKDADVALQLCSLLEAQGVRCWMAPRDLIPGRPYAEECVRGIEASDSFVLLASESAISSVQILSEVEQAHKRRKPIYTILVGKPKVSRELDYYISRLHWIEYGGGSIESVGNRLAKVLSGSQQWDKVAAPPSLRRTVLYRRDAFMGSALATVLVLAAAGLGVGYWVDHKLDLDYRRLGDVTMQAQRSADVPPVMLATAKVQLLAAGVPFRDATFITVVQRPDGTYDRTDRSANFDPDLVDSEQTVTFPIPTTTKRLTTCLIVPSPGLHARYRVTKEFSVPANAENVDYAVEVSQVGEPKVTKEAGEECGAEP